MVEWDGAGGCFVFDVCARVGSAVVSVI
jgi:hypothetical protein